MNVVTALSTLTGIVPDVPDEATAAAAVENSLSATLPGVADDGVGQDDDDDCGGGNFLAGYGTEDKSGDDEGCRRKKAKCGSSHGEETVTISTKSTSKLEEEREAWEQIGIFKLK